MTLRPAIRPAVSQVLRDTFAKAFLQGTTLSDITDTNAAANAVLETAINGTAVGLTAFAAEPGETVTYTLTDSAGGLFAIGLATGIVTKAAALDAETAQSHNITVRATSTSGKTKDRAFSITVTDDTSEFAVGAITDTNAGANEVLESAANGSTVGITASASDADVTDTITYSLDDDAGGRFAIDGSTGIVTVADTGLIDFETQTSHNITVRATSTDTSSSTQGFTITVLNDVSDDGLVPAARFDGTNDSLSRVTPAGAVDNGNALGGLPVRFMGGDGVVQYIWSNSTGSYIRKNADNTIEVFMANAAGVEVFKIISTNGFTVASGQLLIELTKDKLYVNNVDETGTRTTGAGGTIDWTSEWYWGRDSAGGNRLNAECARLYLTNEDIDIAVSRNLFASSFAPITLADIKTDGSGPTGTAALDLLAGAYNAFGINSGTAGNYTTAGMLTVGTGPAGAALTSPSSFAMEGASFAAATTDWLDAPAQGVSGSNDMMVSVWIRRGATGAEAVLASDNPGRFAVGFQSDDEITIEWNDNGGVDRLILNTSSPSFKIVDNEWHHYMAAFHNETSTGGAATGELYIDGVERTNISINTIGTDQFEPHSRGWDIADNFVGDVAQLYVTTENVDLTDPATRAKYYNEAGVDLGSDGSIPTGNQSLAFFNFVSGSLNVNDGSGADAVAQGTVVSSPTSPTDGLFPLAIQRTAETIETADVFNLPSDAEAGDIVVIISSVQGTTLPTTPTNWALKAQDSGFNSIGSVYAKELTAGDVSTGTVTITATGRQAATLYAIRRHNGIDGVEASAVAASGGAGAASTDPPNLTPSWGSKKTLWIAGSCIEEGQRSVNSYPTNYLYGTMATGNSTAISRVSVASAERNVEAASENPGALVWSDSVADGDHVAITVAIEPAP